MFVLDSGLIHYSFIALSLLLVELFYFRIAGHFQITDKPNHRSSHSGVVVRGGGIIFPVAAVIGAVYGNANYFYFVCGLLLISALSFWDDIQSLPFSVRLSVQLISVSVLLAQFHTDINMIFLYPLIFIILLGGINAYNFMDGINGITGGYSLITLCTLYYINSHLIAFTSPPLLLSVILATLVFNIFNFRKRALCFAGDVGSISMAFIISFLIGQLIIRSGNILYIGFMLLYGLDTFTTILFRLIRKENIFRAHRSHFYQFLVNEKRWNHTTVALLYSLMQALINIFILTFLFYNTTVSLPVFTILIVISVILFIILRFKVEGKKRLLGTVPKIKSLQPAPQNETAIGKIRVS